MAFISGSQYNFESRLHRFPTGFIDLINYMIEGQGYTGTALKYEKNQWNKEYIKKCDILNIPTGTPTGIFNFFP